MERYASAGSFPLVARRSFGEVNLTDGGRLLSGFGAPPDRSGRGAATAVNVAKAAHSLTGEANDEAARPTTRRRGGKAKGARPLAGRLSAAGEAGEEGDGPSALTYGELSAEGALTLLQGMHELDAEAEAAAAGAEPKAAEPAAAEPAAAEPAAAESARDGAVSPRAEAGTEWLRPEDLFVDVGSGVVLGGHFLFTIWWEYTWSFGEVY